MQTPVAFIIFNRPDRTAKVFEAIRQARPPMLLVAADGPRVNRLGEAEKCAEARSIIEGIDWPCEVLTNYSDINMGMKQREATAFSWVFDIVEEAILLEDDCLPHPTFFPYCEELLKHYRHDRRIMTISGDNTPLGNPRNRQTQDSYYFSIYARTWGWATWRRAWQHYDLEMKNWPTIRDDSWLEDILRDSREIQFWRNIFQSTYDGFDTWDYQWMLSCWLQNALSIIPTVNLISNLGFDLDGTNTTDKDDPRSNVPTQAMQFPLQHPPFTIPDRQADLFTREHVYILSPWRRAQRKIRKTFRNLKT